MIPYRPAYNSESDKNFYENFTKPSMSDVLSGTWDETLDFNPTTSLGRLLKQDDPEAKTLTPDEANEKYSIGELKFDAPVNEATAKRQYEANYAQIKRSEINRLGPQGFLPTIAKFSTALAGSVIDPLNIASAFIPEIALGRFAAGAVAAGRTATIGQRAAFGVAEGAVGAAIVEPLPYFAAQKDRIEYGLADSMMNIAVGGALGGGLHAVARHMEIRKERAIAEKDAKLQAYLDEYHEAAFRESELSKTVDGMSVEARHGILKTAFVDVLEGRLPRNAARMLQREMVNAQPKGLTEFTFRVDGTLSAQNQQRLAARGGMAPSAAIPVERFESRAAADKFIREQGDRTSYLTQRDGEKVVVLKIKDAGMVRDELGVVKRFDSFEAAKKHADEIGGAQPVGFVKEKGKAQQEFVVIKGIDANEAKALQRDASFAEFYDPNQGAKTSADSEKVLRDNGIEAEPFNFDKRPDEDLFTVMEETIPERISQDELLDIATVEKAEAEADKLIKEVMALDDTILNDKALTDLEAEIALLKEEVSGSKLIADCIINNG